MDGLAHFWNILPNASQVGCLEPFLTPFSGMQGQISQIIFNWLHQIPYIHST